MKITVVAVADPDPSASAAIVAWGTLRLSVKEKSAGA